MFILHRYIIREHIGPFLFAFFVITLVFILNLVFRELGRILSKGLSIWVVLEFFGLNLAWIIALAVPMAVLTATLMAFGRLSADDEITAIKASGISLYKIMTPVLIVSIALAIFLTWFNNKILPDFNHRVRLLYQDIARKRPTLTLEPGVLYTEIPNYNLMVQKVKEKEHVSMAEGILIYDKTNPDINKTILAEKGEIRVTENRGMLTITLYNGEMHEVNLNELEDYRRLKFPKHVITIPLPDMVLRRSDSEYRGDREKSVPMMMAEVKQNKKGIEQSKQRIRNLISSHFKRYVEPYLLPSEGEEQQRSPLKPGLQPMEPRRKKPQSKAYSSLSNLNRALRASRNLLNQIKNEITIIENLNRSNNILLVEIHKKYSIPVACIVFVLVGAPLGIMARRGGIAVGGGISLGFFLLYWAFLIAGEELADRLIISPVTAMWAPNVIVGAAGIYLVIHTVKELTPLRFEMLRSLIPERLKQRKKDDTENGEMN